jgi:hypothetical protein
MMVDTPLVWLLHNGPEMSSKLPVLLLPPHSSMNLQLRRVLTIKYDQYKSENIVLSPDGLLLALWAPDGHLCLRMSHTGEALVEMKTEDKLQAVLWNPTVSNATYRVICGYASGMVGIIEYSMVQVGVLDFDFTYIVIACQHSVAQLFLHSRMGGIYQMAIDDSGTILVAVCDKDTIKVWHRPSNNGMKNRFSCQI